MIDNKCTEEIGLTDSDSSNKYSQARKREMDCEIQREIMINQYIYTYSQQLNE